MNPLCWHLGNFIRNLVSWIKQNKFQNYAIYPFQVDQKHIWISKSKLLIYQKKMTQTKEWSNLNWKTREPQMNTGFVLLISSFKPCIQKNRDRSENELENLRQKEKRIPWELRLEKGRGKKRRPCFVGRPKNPGRQE